MIKLMKIWVRINNIMKHLLMWITMVFVVYNVKIRNMNIYVWQHRTDLISICTSFILFEQERRESSCFTFCQYIIISILKDSMSFCGALSILGYENKDVIVEDTTVQEEAKGPEEGEHFFVIIFCNHVNSSSFY